MEEQPAHEPSHAELVELFVAAAVDDRITWDRLYGIFDIGSVHTEHDPDSPVILFALTHGSRRDQPYLLLTPERYRAFIADKKRPGPNWPPLAGEPD